MLQIDEAVVIPVSNLLNRLKNEYELKADRFHLISVYLLAVLVEVKRFYSTSVKPDENAAFRLTQQYKEALTQYVYEKQKINQYADLLAVTPSHLNKCVKAVTGKSAHELLGDMLLMGAKALLKQTSLSIGEIAFKIGKEDPSDFTRFFRNETGLTPTEYRQVA